jgi:hypothetical protein
VERSTAVNSWGAPPDAPAWAALALGVAFSIFVATKGGAKRFDDLLLWPTRTAFLAAVGALSALLSVLYIHHYLAGGPRIIDATSYYLQARLLAADMVTFEPDGPLASFHSRFLYATAWHGLTPLFPPGYPLLLSFAFRLGAPLMLGPVLAVLLSLATYALALRITRDERCARLGALASCLCAVLRYHTADTMSHGWAALLLASGLVATSLALPSFEQPKSAAPSPLHLVWAAAAGLCAGSLFATRPVSAATAGFATSVLVALARPSRLELVRLALGFTAGAVVPIASFLWHQRHLTGSFGQWVQHAYYLSADGPPGCIRLGFGQDIGCKVEHGDFVQLHLPDGYGPVQALGTTLRRLSQHWGDVANSRLGLPFCALAAWLARKQPKLSALTAICVVHMLAYAAFYYDGNYPGGGGRMFADVLPLEHVLLAWGAVHLHLSRWLPGALLCGFALSGAYQHELLGQREGGRPMFETSTLERHAPHVELVFMDTDHGFNLAFDPQAPTRFARLRGDAYDRALWEHLGKPEARVYVFDVTGSSPPSLAPFVPSTHLRYEAESGWPTLKLTGGWAQPNYEAAPCVSAGKHLLLHPSPGETLQLEAQIWVPRAGAYRLEVYGRELSVSAPDFPTTRLATSKPAGESARAACASVSGEFEQLPSGPLRLFVQVSQEGSVDAYELTPLSTASP